jgi:hypothetical protein
VYSLLVEAEAAVRRWMRASLFLAAVLSVISVPLAVIFIGHNQGAAWTLAAAIGTALAALLSFFFSTVTYVKSSAEARSTNISRVRVRGYARHKRAARYLYVSLPKRLEGPGGLGKRNLVSYPTEVQLLLELSAIEQEAQGLLGEGHGTSVIRLRSRLQELGIWSDSDIYDFDVALRTRNKVVHGDEEELSEKSVTDAVETMRRLRQKLETSQPQEGS